MNKEKLTALDAETKKKLRALAKYLAQGPAMQKAKKSLAWIIDEHENELNKNGGLVLDGLKLSIKYSKQLIVEEVEG